LLWAFDLMQLSGDDLRAVALADRKRRLGHLIGRTGIARLRHSIDLSVFRPSQLLESCLHIRVPGSR
jgi:ATP-dependent DNA ligase